jgi:aspartate-semialdehyde dehydrogenase
MLQPTKVAWLSVIQKIMWDRKIKVTATCVRAGVHGHSDNIEFETELSAEDAQKIPREAPGVMLAISAKTAAMSHR